MKLAALCPAVLIVFVFVLATGCVLAGYEKARPPVATDTGAGTAGEAAWPGTLALSAEEMPFPVVQESHETLVMTGEQTETSRILLGYTRTYWSETQNSPTADTFIQTIAVYPAGSAETVYAEIRRQHQPGNARSFYTMLPDPGAGNESFSIGILPGSGATPDNPVTIVTFRKANVIETIIVKSPSLDPAGVAAITRAAAAKIPETGYSIPEMTMEAD